MKERQRWQPEEDSLLRAYVKQYGPREWSLLPQRMAKPLHRDPKSCLERWKNYLRPGLKKGSLTPDEQSLVVSLQSKYGNKWKKIAAELPGRTPKRLGKWWEVFKDKQLKLQHHRQQQTLHHHHQSPRANPLQPQESQYDHILETFAEKYVIPPPPPPATPPLLPAPLMPTALMPADLSLSGVHGDAPSTPVLSLATTNAVASSDHHYHHHPPIPSSSPSLPPWMSSATPPNASSSTHSPATNMTSPSVSLSLSPSEPRSPTEVVVGHRFLPLQHSTAASASTLVQLVMDLEEGRQNWMQHRKEAAWRLSRLEQQLESDKGRKKREKVEEVEAKIRSLREEETACLDRIDTECREQLLAIQRDADAKEAKMVEAWASRHAKLARLANQVLANGPVGGNTGVAAGDGLRHHFPVNKDLR